MGRVEYLRLKRLDRRSFRVFDAKVDAVRFGLTLVCDRNLPGGGDVF